MATLRMNHGTGNPNAKIFIIKDSPSFDEVRRQEYLSDSAGLEFRKMLREAGIISTDVYCSSVSKTFLMGKTETYFSSEKKHRENKVHFSDNHFVSPFILDDLEKLEAEIAAVNPTILVPLDPLALFLCSKETSISTWRGSVNWSQRFNRKFIPTYNPSLILKVWNWRYHSVRDLQRVAHEQHSRELVLPPYRFKIAPTFNEVMIQLQKLINEADAIGRI